MLVVHCTMYNDTSLFIRYFVIDIVSLKNKTLDAYVAIFHFPDE